MGAQEEEEKDARLSSNGTNFISTLTYSNVGFARRYFILYHSGLLAYAFEPGQPLRDQVSLHQAAISTAPGRKDIHIDSSTATFHIKCLSTDDFNTWMTAFRSRLAFASIFFFLKLL